MRFAPHHGSPPVGTNRKSTWRAVCVLGVAGRDPSCLTPQAEENCELTTGAASGGQGCGLRTKRVHGEDFDRSGKFSRIEFGGQ